MRGVWWAGEEAGTGFGGLCEVVGVFSDSSKNGSVTGASPWGRGGKESKLRCQIATNQFFPLFTSSIDSVAGKQNYSTTLHEDLPLINHPVVQAGSNFGSANNEIAPKQRGLMLKRGQALYVAASGATALTNGFYCNVQGGFY